MTSGATSSGFRGRAGTTGWRDILQRRQRDGSGPGTWRLAETGAHLTDRGRAGEAERHEQRDVHAR